MAARSFIRKVGTGNIYNESDEFMAGQSIWFDGPPDKIPAGWLIKNGAAISRTTYATLFAVIGTMHGAGDGATTFNLPDDRGEFTRGLDLGRGVDAGRVQGSAQGDEFKSHSHTWKKSVTAAFGTVNNLTVAGTVNDGGDNVTNVAGGTETRPRNRASIPIIKYS